MSDSQLYHPGTLNTPCLVEHNSDILDQKINDFTILYKILNHYQTVELKSHTQKAQQWL